MDEAATPLRRPLDGDPVDHLALSDVGADVSSVVGTRAPELESLLAEHAQQVAATIRRLGGVSDPDAILSAHHPHIRWLAQHFGANLTAIAWDQHPVPGRRAWFQPTTATIMIRPSEATNLTRFNATLVHEIIHAAQTTTLSRRDIPPLWTTATNRWRESLTGPGRRHATTARDNHRAAAASGTPTQQQATYHQVWTIPHEADARIIATRFTELLAHALTNPTQRRDLLHQLSAGAHPSSLIAPHTAEPTTQPATNTQTQVDTAILHALIAAAAADHHALTAAIQTINAIRHNPDHHQHLSDPETRFDWITALISYTHHLPNPSPQINRLTEYLAQC
jgi:hypothetical protein